MAKQRKSGGNKKDPRTSTRVVFSDVNGAIIIPTIRKLLRDPKYYKPESFQELLKQLGLTIELPLKAVDGETIQYAHPIVDYRSLGLQHNKALEEQVDFLIFQKLVIAQVKTILDKLTTSRKAKEFVTQLLADKEKKEQFLSMTEATPVAIDQ